MIPVFMVNDMGGILYVGKNELCLVFTNGIKHTIRLNTKQLQQRLNSLVAEEIETEKYLIEVGYKDSLGAKLVIVTAKCTGEDCDKATVFQCDLFDALDDVEEPVVR